MASSRTNTPEPKAGPAGGSQAEAIREGTLPQRRRNLAQRVQLERRYGIVGPNNNTRVILNDGDSDNGNENDDEDEDWDNECSQQSTGWRLTLHPHVLLTSCAIPQGEPCRSGKYAAHRCSLIKLATVVLEAEYIMIISLIGPVAYGVVSLKLSGSTDKP